jgi:putative addiction module killer protein
MRYTLAMRVEQTEEFRRWIDRLADKDGRARILVRIDRLVHGNPGSHRNLTDGITELRIDFGPGYRVYYSLQGNTLLLLLAGGDKSSQQRDIAVALSLKRSLLG